MSITGTLIIQIIVFLILVGYAYIWIKGGLDLGPRRGNVAGASAFATVQRVQRGRRDESDPLEALP